MTALRAIFRYWVLLMTAAVVVQIGFAGYGAFRAADEASNGVLNEDAFGDAFTLHAALGTLIIFIGAPLLIILALLARPGRPIVLHSLGVFVLLVAQLILGWTGAELPAVLGLLHPINAFIILGALGALANRLWRPAVGPAEMPAPAPSPPA